MGLILGVAMFFGAYRGVPMLLAQEGSTAPEAVSGSGIGGEDAPVTAPVSDLDKKCTTELPPFFEQEKKKLVTFMNTHFKNAAPNSSLLPVALDHLQNYRNELTRKRASFLTLAGLQADALQEIAYCNDLLKEQLAIADEVFRTYVQDTAYSKRSTALSDKLRSINGKLKNLNDLLGQFDGYFTAFSDKLPKFTEKCVQQ